MSGKNFFLYSLLISFLINFFLYFIFENKSAIGQGAYCQPLPYLTFSGSWPGQGYLVMTSSTQNVLVRYAGTGAGIVSGSGSPGQIAFWSGSSILSGDNNLFWDNTNKRLGIGTTTPQTALHVVGNITATNFIGNYAGTISAANVSSGVFGSLTGNGNFSFPAFLGISTSSQLNLPQPLSVYGNAYISGNVGIGTTAPDGRLHIQSISGTIGLRLSLNPGQPAGYDNSPMVMWDSTNMGATRVYWMRQEGNYWRFKVSDTSWGNLVYIMTVDTSGNVGIGTMEPRAKLSVHGTRSSTVSTTTAAANIGGDDLFLYINAMNTSPWSVWMQVLSNAGVAFPLVLNPSGGNVGIGTTAPQTKLHIFENVSQDALLIDTSGWPIRRIIQKGGVIVEGFIPYDPNPLLGWGNKVMRITKPTIDLLNFDILGRTTQWAARVYGCIYVPTSGTYTFYLTTDDGARFWVNWQILVDQWKDQAPTTYSANYTFSTPGWYPIRIDHYNNASGERLLLEWSGPGITRQTVPSSNLGVCWPDLF